jgi:ferrous iron transport protein B
MQSIGLNGKAFVPLIMGFGCNVPAIMATRMLESRNERMLTMFIIPFMSCFARLPVYVLLIGAFFPGNPGIMLFLVYLFGIFVSILTAMVLSRTVFKSPINPANLELQVYRRPDYGTIWTTVRKNVGEFLKKIGGIILIGSMIIWTLSYFPRHENVSQREQMELSYLGQIGKAIEPVLRPIGFDWRMSVAALVGISAKELIVSTMSILYLGEEIGEGQEEQQRFIQRLADDPDMNRRNALAFLVFALLYFPCIAVFGAIKSESGRWRYAVLITLYTTGVAWVAAFAVYQIGRLFGL